MLIDRGFAKRVFLYGVIGGGSAALDMLVFVTLNTHLSINEITSNTVSVHCGILSSFILNRNFNFKRFDRTTKRLLSFYLVGLGGLCLSNVILACGMSLGLPINWVKFASIFLVAAVQFALNSLITFGK